MTARLHHTEKQGHGGKRMRHVPPLLLPEQVERIRLARAVGTPFKELERELRCSRKTLYRAAHGDGPYANYAADSTARIKALVEDAAKWRAHVAAGGDTT